MEIQSRIKHWLGHLTLAAIVVALLSAWNNVNTKAVEQEKVIQTLLRAKAADEKAVATREKLRTKRAVEAPAKAAGAAAALAAAPAWADTPIPDEVQDALSP
jgi:hypothetical protein